MAHKHKKTTEKTKGGNNPPLQHVNKRAAEKRKKTWILSVISVVVLIAIVVAVVIVTRKNNMLQTTRITTYTIDQITYGNVSNTISGSGSLSPITKQTLTVADCLAQTDGETDGETESEDESGAVTQSMAIDGAGEMLPPSDAPVSTGVVGGVQVGAGDSVDAGDVIATVTFDDGTATEIVAPYDSVLLEFYLHEDDEVTMTSNVAMFMGKDGYSMSISVDENNISTVKIGQEVSITVDAVSGDYTGAVTDISYNGSTSGSVTAYQIKVGFDYIEGTYPGMGVSAEIVIEDSGDGLLVPVDAVYTSGDTKYMYLAPADAELGDEYEEGTLDLSKLTKVTVATGMSDGSYMIVDSEEIEEGDLIVITKITSTVTGSDGTGSGNMSGGMGSFPGNMGGGMGSFPGGNFDFGDFDFSQIPGRG